MTTRFSDHLLTGPHSSLPAASAVPPGTIYSCTTHNLIYQSNGIATWSTYATLGGGGGGTTVATDTLWDTKGDLAVATGADAASKLVVGSNGQVLTADSAQTTGLKWASAAGGGVHTLLSTTTIAGSAAAFDVSGISGSYNDLLLVLIGRASFSASNDSVMLRFNNDSGSNYATSMYSVTTAGAAFEQSTDTKITPGIVPAASASAGWFGTMQILIAGYASTSWNKTCLCDNVYATALTAGQKTRSMGVGAWASTAAINRVQLLINDSPNTFVIGSQLRIYGRL